MVLSMNNYTHIINIEVKFGDEYTIPKNTKVKVLSEDPHGPYSYVEDEHGAFSWVENETLSPKYLIENPEDLDRIINE
jgi:hypothetical protein